MRIVMSTQVAPHTSPLGEASGCVVARVLLVDDDKYFRLLARKLIEPDGFDVSEAADVRQCLALLKSQPIDAVILDMVMPGRNGVDAVPELKLQFPSIKIITVSGVEESDVFLTVSSYMGADASLNKSNIGSLSALLRVVLDR